MKRESPDAHTDYDVYAEFYDLEFDAFDADLSMYQMFAARTGGPILELGCGTGRVLRALSDGKYSLTGIDRSPAMLSKARSRLGDEVQLIQADMLHLDVEAALPDVPYSLVFSAVNSFLHLPDSSAQTATLHRLKAITSPGGLLLLDVFVPDHVLLKDMDEQLVLEFSCTLSGDRRLDKWAQRRLDLATQTIVTDVMFDVTDHAGNVKRYFDRYVARYIHRFEMEHLLARSGWKLESIYGGYDLDAFDSSSERMIVVALNDPDV